MEKYIRVSDAVQTVMEKPDMTPDEKAGIIRRLKAVPAADVVEVVRCYECKYWEHRPDRQYDLCAYLIGAKHSCTPEDFCSRGERKGGQDDA